MILSWLRTRRRRRLLATPLAADERAVLERLRFYAKAPADERARLEALARVIVAERRGSPAAASC